MQLKINIINCNLSDLKQLIVQIQENDHFDWDYFWSTSNIDNTFEYFVGSFENYLNWDNISKNTFIKWTDSRIETFQDKINFKILSDNINLSCSTYTIQKFSKKWNWKGYNLDDSRGKRVMYEIGGLSANPKLPLDINFLKRVEDFLDFRSLGHNPALFFNSKNVHPDDFDAQGFENSYKILHEFMGKWSAKGSYWDDGDYSGYSKDSIYDNPNIDWTYYEEYKKRINSLQKEDDDLPF